MSKQLLHTFQSHLVIVALNDRAFVIVKNRLDGHNNIDLSSSLEEDNNSLATTISLHAQVLELSVAATSNSNGNGGGGSSGVDDAMGKLVDEAAEGKNRRSNNNPHEIQAVCCTETESQIWLAVSRENKTLSLYSIPVPYLQESHERTKTNVYPTITYNLPKRAKCLSFGIVPSSSAVSAPHCHVIITGDLAGDAIAYPLILPTNSSSEDVTASTNPFTTTAITRRLLLGHTASILTGLHLVPSFNPITMEAANDDGPRKHQTQFILTADRDEKIRVSHFPETHIIHGYLLGHSSFISSMDATMTSVLDFSSSIHGSSNHNIHEDNGSQRPTRPLCITGSGDGTVRLWDYQMCKEVGMVPVMMKKRCTTDENNVEDTNMPAEEDNSDDDFLDDHEQEEKGEEEECDDNFDEDLSEDDEVTYGHTIAVPISVALSPEGNIAAVIRDGISSIDVYPIPRSLSRPVSLHKKMTLDCPYQPLAVKWLGDGTVMVLGMSPDYLFHFQCNANAEAAEVVSFNDVSSTSPFCMALKSAVGCNHIDVPNTTLDRMWNKVHDPDYDRSQERGNDGGDHTPHKGNRGDFYWNDARRKEIDKLAQQRRKKRRREGQKMKAEEK
jgi:hypothetical protein